MSYMSAIIVILPTQAEGLNDGNKVK
jgi:hypothetical protein